jgi:hypothetical protein
VAAYQDPKKVTIGRTLVMPFTRRGDDWVRPDGSPAIRPHSEVGKTTLLP